MSIYAHGDTFAELDALVAVQNDGHTPEILVLIAELDAIVASTEPYSPRPGFVADEYKIRPENAQENKLAPEDPASVPQCANQPLTLTDPLTLSGPPSNGIPPCVRKASDQGRSGQKDVVGVFGKIAGRALEKEKTRKARRKAARLDLIARTKTWDGRKSKGRKDRLSAAEKFSAAVWHTAAAGGLAVSLNLGIRRESMLVYHEAPRRRMMQNLHRQLSSAGFRDLPYAFTFEMTPEADGDRLHLHGVIDTSGLSTDQICLLSELSAPSRRSSVSASCIRSPRSSHREKGHAAIRMGSRLQ